MNRPTMSEFDGWKNSATGIWFFEHYLQGYADIMAGENGRGVGVIEETIGKELLTFVKNAGVICGVESVISLDPFDDEREELENNDEVDLDR